MRPRRPRRPKLRTRVLAGVLGVTLIVLVAFDIAAVTALRGYLIGQTDSQLRSVLNVYRLVNAFLPGPGGARRIAVRPPPPVVRYPNRRQARPAPHVQAAGRRVPVPLQPFSFTLVSGRAVKAVSPTIAIRGVAFGGNPGLIPPSGVLLSLAADGRGTTATSLHGNQLLRLMAVPALGKGTLVAATSLAGVNDTVGQVELILIIGSAAAGLLAAGGAAWIMRRGLRPIETMAAQAEAITAGDIASRVTAHDPQSEVGRLATAINGMLGRIGDFIADREASQEAARRFFADASHELRTPLASLRANAELYQQGALARHEQVDEAMHRITAEARRMSVLLDDMLRLARLDQHPERAHDPVDITALIGECVQRAEIADPERSWHTKIATGLVTNGDEELLRRAVDNLLANVQAHTPAGTLATISAADGNGKVTVEVSDNGPGVPADRLARIFERFYRAAAPSQRRGSGLGLAIVSAIAAAHGGGAEAALNQPHGLRVTLTLPAAAPGAAEDPA